MSIEKFTLSLLICLLFFHSIHGSGKHHKKHVHNKKSHFYKLIHARNPSIPPFIKIDMNRTNTGVFSLVYPGPIGKENENIVLNYASQFMQDAKNRRIYLSSGDEALGDSNCFNKYWYEENKFYVMTYTNNNCSIPLCECFSGYGYLETVNFFNSTYFGYIGRFYSYKAQKEVDIFTGRNLDATGPITINFHYDWKTGAFIAIEVLETHFLTGKNPYIPYFLEYFYNDIKMIQPNPKYFIVPEVCIESEKSKGCSNFPY